MIKKFPRCLVFSGLVLVMVAGCGKFDQSSIKMPKFKFVTTENLHSLACADSGDIWASGNYGTIIHSSDRGKKWKKQKTGVEELLCCIEFASKNKGWAAGVRGVIIHTSDGGKTWTAQQSGTENNFMDLFFLDDRHGWAVGEFGTVIHTDNGGKTWTAQMEAQDTIYNDVFFVDTQTGWIVGEFGTILHTGDGGKTWQPQKCQDIVPVIKETDWAIPLPALYGIFFKDKNKGWIVGMEGIIIETEDGGKTWSRVDSGTDKPLYNIKFRGSKAWVVGNKGVYLMSDDNGKTWTVKDKAIKTKFWLRDVLFCDDKNGVIVGARGTIARSGDGGATWQLISGFSYDMEEFGLADF